MSTEEELLEFLYICPIGLIEFDSAGDIGMINPYAMQHLITLSPALDEMNFFSSFDSNAPEFRSMIAAFEPDRGVVCDGHRIFLGLGIDDACPQKVLACTLVKLRHSRFMATLTDISQQVIQEQRLRQADTWFAALLDGVNDYAALSIAPCGKVETATKSFTRQTGYKLSDIVGNDLADVLGSDIEGGDLQLAEQFKIAMRNGWYLQEGWQQRADGGRYWCQRLVVARSDSNDADGSGFSVVLRDVPRREVVAADLRRELTRDHLTGAVNRRHFSQVMVSEKRHWRQLSRPLSLAVIDLDNFKAVNDVYGHPIGDLVLRRVSGACAGVMPFGGVFARLGGEEFGALLPDHNYAQALALAEALREAIAAIEIETPQGGLRITASVGVANLDETEGSIDALVALADERLYAAKREGKNRVYYPAGWTP